MSHSEQVNILLVDDLPSNLMALESIFADSGYNIVKANTANEALSCLLKQDYVVVLFDVNLPDMDGFELAKLVRSIERMCHTPIIFVSAINKDDADLMIGYKLGAVDYIFKPLVPEIIRAKVKVFVDLHKRTQMLTIEQKKRKSAEVEKEKLEKNIDELIRYNEELELSNLNLVIKNTDLQKENVDLEEVQSELASTNERLRQIGIEEQVARKQAEQDNRDKDHFFAKVTHEIRAPLTAIMGWIRLLQAGKLDKEATSRALEVIARNAMAQSKLVDDLLEVSRIINGKIELSVQVIDPPSIVLNAIESFRPAAESKKIDLQVSISPNVEQFSGDPNRLEQIINNLLSNAIKFTPEHGLIQVQLEYAGHRIELRVIDTGKGIDPQFLPYVFEPFRQGENSGDKKYGLGLGLAIVRHLVELHGGIIEAHSLGEGKGATFIAKFPLSSNG